MIEEEKYKIDQSDVFSALDKIPTASIDLCITDPPYYVLVDGKAAREEAGHYADNNWDRFNSVSDFASFTEDWFSVLKTKMKNNSYIFIFWSQKYLSLGHKIFKPDRTLIWSYNNLLNTPKGDFVYDYEPIFIVKKGKPKLSTRSLSVLNYTKPQSNFRNDKAEYATQKPRALLAHLLRTVGLPKGSLVLDCFQGSGVVGEQAILQGYTYLGIDASPKSIEISSRLLRAASAVHTLLD